MESLNFELLKNRGPNSFESIKIDINGGFHCYFVSSVLSLRGHQVTKQPIFTDLNGNILIWNGEIFNSSLIKIDSNENDGLKLFEALDKAKTIQEIFDIFSSIKGPYSFVYLARRFNKIFYGRDRLGRRSLLIRTNENMIMLSSVKVFSTHEKLEFDELKANGFYTIDLNENCLNSISQIEWGSEFLQDKIVNFNDSVEKIDYSNEETVKIQENLETLLLQSIKRRIDPFPHMCKSCYEAQKCLKNENKCQHAKIGILFSGGLDSAVIAALVDKILPPLESIDLLNIAFEQIDKDKPYLVPDRISGLECLKDLNPLRKWNFVQINITNDELKSVRAEKIKNLLYPLKTVLDDSIGCAIWFASRGKGVLLNGDEYQSNAEILLLGMGADEQLGGYARHRTRFRNEGYIGLINELKMEIERLPERNLARDDRIISDHGKESRLPYLDEDVVNYLNGLQIFDKVDFSKERGIGEKYLLRQLAIKLGLNVASKLAKRAIQFGSRVAKMENSKEKASDSCTRLADNDLE